jgi:hypothetical protein
MLSPRNLYVVKISRVTYAMARPANRPELARWLKYVDRREEEIALSPYLAAGAKEVQPRDQLVVLWDLSETVSAEQVKKRLNEASGLAGTKFDPDAVAQVIAGIRGLKFSTRVTGGVAAELRVDFNDSPEPLAPIALPLLLHVMRTHGAAIPAVANWQAKVSGNSLVYQGELTGPGFHDVFSLLRMPQAALESQDPAAGERRQDELTLAATRSYYRGVKGVVDKVQRLVAPPEKSQLKRDQPHWNAEWYAVHAQTIDNLPTANVDPEALTWGQSVAAKIRAMASSLQGDTVEVAALDKSKSTVVYGGGNRWSGGVWGSSNVGQVQEKQADAVSRGERHRLDLMAAIRQETDAMRAKLSARYKQEF